jgi:hypothetical protein
LTHDPDDPGTPHGDRDEHRNPVEAAVETVEEVVEEVVEHVPKSVRWTIGKIVMLIGLGLVGLVLLAMVTAVLYVSNRTEWAAQELAIVVNQVLGSRSDVTLAISDIKGNPFSGIRVMSPSVRFRDGSRPPLLEARSMSLRYSAWDLAMGRDARIIAEIDRPVVRFGRRPDGSLRFPTWKPGGPAKSPGRRDIDFQLRLTDGIVALPEKGREIRGLRLDATAAIGGDAGIEVKDLRWASSPYGPLDHLRASLSTGDSVVVTVHELRAPSLALTGRAQWKTKSTERRVHAEVQRVEWAWLADVFDNRSLDVTGQGSVVVDARGDQGDKRWVGQFTGRVNWDSLPVDASGRFAWGGERLVLAPVLGRSPAGNLLDGRVEWSKAGWEVGGEAREADPAQWAALNLRGWPAGRLAGRFRYAVDTRAKPPSSFLVARLGESEWTGWRVDSARVTIGFPAVGPDTFSVRAHRRGGEMGLLGRVVEKGWLGTYAIARLPLDEWPDGRASGIRGLLDAARGTVESRGDGLWVTGELSGSETDWLGLHAARWRLGDVAGFMLPKPDLTAGVRLHDALFLGIHFDSMATPIALIDQRVVLDSLRAQAGDTLVALSGRADWDDAGWRFEASRASMTSGSFDWTAEPPVRLSGDPKGTRFERVVARDREAEVAITGEWASPGGRYDWTARARALDLSRLGLPAEWGLAGRSDATLRIWGISGDPRWELQAAGSGIGTQEHRADSLRMRIGGSPGRLDVSELGILLDGGSVNANGSVGGTSVPWPDTLTGDGVLRWLSEADRWTGAVRSENLPLDRLGRIAAARSALGGRLTAHAEIGGSPQAPELRVTGQASPFVWGDYRIDVIDARGSYRDGRLEVPELKLSRGGVNGSVRGEMPIVLAMGRKPELPDRPMSWRIDLPNADLSLVPLFVPQIGHASGRFDLDATMTGTPRTPELAGTARVRDGRLRLAGREEVLEGVQLAARFDEAKLTIDTLSARQETRRGEPGRVWGKGELDLQGMAVRDYDFQLQLRDFTAQEPGLYVALFDGDFTITPGSRLRGQVLPHVQGQVEVRQAIILFDFTNQSSVQQVSASTQRLYWTYAMHLSATDNLFWRPPNADVELSADLDVSQSLDSLVIYGDVRSIRGTYYFLSNRFNVESAELTFDNLGGVNPQVLAVATTEVSSVSGGDAAFGSERERERITVTVTNRAREPQITFSSESGWGEAEVLRAITVGQLGGNFGLGNPLDSYITQAINRQLDAEMSRVFQGYVEQWEVRRESGGLVGGEGSVFLGASVPLTPQLRVRYQQRIPGLDRPLDTSGTLTDLGVERDIEAEFRLNRFFVITSELTQRRTLTGGVTTVSGTPDFNVNLKARWEY